MTTKTVCRCSEGDSSVVYVCPLHPLEDRIEAAKEAVAFFERMKARGRVWRREMGYRRSAATIDACIDYSRDLIDALARLSDNDEDDEGGTECP